MFYFEFPSDLQTQQPVVQVLDLRHPVIDFSLDGTGDVWVLTDCERQGSSSIEASAGAEKRSVRLLRWIDGKVRTANLTMLLCSCSLQLVELGGDNIPSLVNILNDSAKVPGMYHSRLRNLSLTQ